MRRELGLLRASGALLAGAAALLMGTGRAAADFDGAGLYVLPPDPVVLIPEALCPETVEPEGVSSRGVIGQIRALAPQAERLQEIGVMPLFLGFHGFGLKVRGKM